MFYPWLLKIEVFNVLDELGNSGHLLKIHFFPKMDALSSSTKNVVPFNAFLSKPFLSIVLKLYTEFWWGCLD